MKFIHIADTHFDTPFTFLGENENLGDIRRLEQRQAFKQSKIHKKDNNRIYK